MPFTFKVSEREATLILDALDNAVETGLNTPFFETDDFAEVAGLFADRLKW